jgi:pyruvate dehydrogenase E2 component (dihydrolipoamide acetyltransferase)
MAFEFELPDVGEGIAEGEIVEWHVSAGDRVEEDQVMADVETDKAVVDLPAPVTGTVVDLHAEEGEMVPVGTVVATIEVEGEVEEAVEEENEEAVEPADDAGEPADAAGDATDGSTPADDGEAVEAATGDGRVFAPPNVRRLARELGVDITAVDGSGPGGRITEGDVRTTAESGGADDAGDDGDEPKSAVTRVSGEEGDGTGAAGGGATASGATAGGAAATTATVETADREQTLATPATRNLADELDVDLDEVPTDRTRDGEAYVEEADVRAFAEAREAAEAAEPAAGGAGGAAAPESASASAAATGERETREPYTGIRRTIGKQMEKSAFTAPRAAHYDQADVSALVETRERLKARAEEQGIKLTYMPFIIKAIVAALKEYPELNTELDEDTEEIIYKHYYNIGIAVATDAGLMVPVLKDADKKGMLQIASEVNELASKARERKVSPQEMQGGTFTITNFGVFGGEYALPIINHPETAILGLGSIEQRPVVEEGETTESSRNASDTAASTGEVVARHTLPLSVAIDHRVIDGAEAAQFCNTVIEYLENPELLLLE